jgi:ribosome recycling factor
MRRALGAAIGSHLSSLPVTTAARRLLVLLPTACLRKDVVRGDRGESRRLTFDERAERRLGKSRENSGLAEQKREEASAYVNQEFPDALEGLFSRYLHFCQTHYMKVVNLLKFLERAEIEVAPGNKVLLLQLASIVKTSPTEVEITLQSPSHLNIVSFRLQKLEGSIQLRRDGAAKIKVTVPPITSERREQAAKAIASTIADLRAKLKLQRASANKVLNQFGVDDNTLRELTADLDEKLSSMSIEKIREMEELAENVLSATGLEESD